MREPAYDVVSEISTGSLPSTHWASLAPRGKLVGIGQMFPGPDLTRLSARTQHDEQFRPAFCSLIVRYWSKDVSVPSKNTTQSRP